MDMGLRNGRQRISAGMAGLFLSALVFGQASAATWGQPIKLGTNSVAVDIVAVGSSTLVAGLKECFPATECALRLRRSTNSGATWLPAVTLGTGNHFIHGPFLSARGTAVDAVWANGWGRIRYARSTDGGATFGAPVTLSDGYYRAMTPRIARGPGGVVAVIWQYVESRDVNVRVSTDGGATFGPRKRFLSQGSWGMSIAVGDGVIYAAYSVQTYQVRIRRSLDAGTSWSAPVSITDNSHENVISMTAAGSAAYVAYAVAPSGDYSSQAKYRRTANKGATWSSPISLSSSTWRAGYPDVDLRGGVLRAALVRWAPEGDADPSKHGVYYRQSSDGLTWTAAVRASPLGEVVGRGHVTFASQVAVLYTRSWTDDTSGQWFNDSYVRTGSP